MPELKVLVVGGYGFFGRRLVERLLRQPALEVWVAGRSTARAQALVDRLHAAAPAAARARAVALDAGGADITQHLRGLHPHVLVDASGPFQGADPALARACIAAGVNYIDLADARDFVCSIASLDAAARAAGVAVISGASSVPALSGAAADALAQDLERVESIDIGISPGNRTERGLSTVQAVLGYCGQSLPSAGAQRRFGWVGTRSHRYPPPVGVRLLSPCDVPDLALLPERYRGRPRVDFGAGLELRFLHRGMNAMAWARQRGWVRNWATHARWLKRVADLFDGLGSEAGAMHVSVLGHTREGARVTRRWELVATTGHGPYVPTLASAALVRRMAEGGTLPAGASPCVGMLGLDDFIREAEGLQIRMGRVYP